MKHIILLSVIFIFFISCSGADDDQVSSASWDQSVELLPVAVEVLDISEGQLTPYVESSGIIKGIKETWILSETSGTIREVNASLGLKVQKGDVLLSVDNELQKLNRDLALQQFESAQQDFDAQKSSYERGGLSRSNFNAAKSRLLQSETAYKSAEKAYEATFIRAPFDGTLALLGDDFVIGGTLSPGAPVALVIDTSRMKMDISLGERQVDLISVGQEVEVLIASRADKRPLNAVVEAIGAASESRTGSFPVIISWDNPYNGSMRSGLSAKVLIKNTRETEQIIVPSSSLVTRDRKSSLFVAIEGKAQLKEVVTGESLGGHTVIREGVDSGDQLIISAITSLSDGYPVEVSLVGDTGGWR